MDAGNGVPGNGGPKPTEEPHDAEYFSLALSSFRAPGSRQLVRIVYYMYLVLSFLLMYSSNG